MTDTQVIAVAEKYMDTVFRVAYSYLRCQADAVTPMKQHIIWRRAARSGSSPYYMLTMPPVQP